MTTKKHTTTLISLAAGLCVLAGTTTASAIIGDATSFDPNDRPGMLSTSSEMTAPGYFTPGFFIDPSQTPVGYIDIPEIDRGPEGDGDGGTSESNLPADFGDFEGPDWLFSPFEIESTTPVAASSGSVLDLLYTSAPDLTLSLENKQTAVEFSSIPAPGTGLLGIVGGLALVRRRR